MMGLEGLFGVTTPGGRVIKHDYNEDVVLDLRSAADGAEFLRLPVIRKWRDRSRPALHSGGMKDGTGDGPKTTNGRTPRFRECARSIHGEEWLRKAAPYRRANAMLNLDKAKKNIQDREEKQEADKQSHAPTSTEHKKNKT